MSENYEINIKFIAEILRTISTINMKYIIFSEIRKYSEDLPDLLRAKKEHGLKDFSDLIYEINITIIALQIEEKRNTKILYRFLQHRIYIT